jgi:S-DNA-T family DNA segregation ATPase FtsK/SpoIIIE
LDILERAPVEPEVSTVDNALRMRVIEDTLASFNVRARVIGAHSGPTVTQFEVQPERGVRVQRITALQNDLALALAARSIRIQAPVPGQSVIGIEIPNAKTSVVALREVMESEACARLKVPLKIALGKDVSGGPVLADLARMPHLLIAGATGSGKSVCLNSLISCLLFHNGPDRLRLLMVDPKMVELTVFNDVPHLLTPVVTDVKKVTTLLKWAIKEMHRRYTLFAEVGARNITRYNEMRKDPKERLPFIVIVIDELADLMMVSPEDVEEHICRLAQLARATGMHLVIATQRPSVDVITGLIKANFPARIAFAVSSQVDSRTILDQAGAEKLLGRGDMLYQPSDEGKPIRVQGAWLAEREIEALVRFWKQNPSRGIERIPDEDLAESEKGGDDDPDEKLMNDAIRVLREYRRASVSLLQRRLSIGYTRAARLLDALEDRGVVGPSEDGRSRIVLDAGGMDDHDDLDMDDEAPPL